MEEGWAWVDAVPESYLGWHVIKHRKAERLYPEPGELSEDEMARYEELSELANAEVLDDAGLAELDALQDLLDGDYTDA